MIRRIEIEGVASFRARASLVTEKKVSLVYGLNGTGKTTIADYLYDTADERFVGCKIDQDKIHDILVYNHKFIDEYFYQPDGLRGIFTLSKENKEAEEKIEAAKRALDELTGEIDRLTQTIESQQKELATIREAAEEATWEIKTEYSGGDRVFDYCLVGHKSSKSALFSHLRGLSKPIAKPDKTTESLEHEVKQLRGDRAQKYDPLPKVVFDAADAEADSIFQTPIVGNEDSVLSALIDELGNVDWVKQGLKYVREDTEKPDRCPFCQQQTITNAFLQSLREYFGQGYENFVHRLTELANDYEFGISNIPDVESCLQTPLANERRPEFIAAYSAVSHLLATNLGLMKRKLSAPSEVINLESSSRAIEELNSLIDAINDSVKRHNDRIENRQEALMQISHAFWELMRWEYDQTLVAYEGAKQRIEQKIRGVADDVTKHKSSVSALNEQIATWRRSTVNTDEAVANINEGLLDLGIDGFRIEKHSDRMYRLMRTEPCDDTFRTLSEGEKTIVTFLYFRELCKGRRDVDALPAPRVVVIDDPISSLSHVYVFNIGQFIKREFFKSSELEQVIVLTHSLYFFYELADTNHERRRETQVLFRIDKNSAGSRISPMTYDEIQNDYHAYWRVICDRNQQPALIANCMRNVLEYFFGFIEKRDFNQIFQKPVLQANKYQAFARYVNRESHSIGQNIFDLKEFDYEDFREALRLVFAESGFEAHYSRMTRSAGK